MDTYQKNLYTIENLRLINKELDDISFSLKKKVKINQKYILFLKELLDNSNNNLYKIIDNLENK